jgi:hypothetical protein
MPGLQSLYVMNRAQRRPGAPYSIDSCNELIVGQSLQPANPSLEKYAAKIHYYGGCSDIYISVHFGETLGGLSIAQAYVILAGGLAFILLWGGARIYISPYISARLSAVLASPRF